MGNPSISSRAHSCLPFLGIALLIAVAYGCATPLAKPKQLGKELGCQASDKKCYLKGIERFNHYRDNKQQKMIQNSGSYRAPSAPFVKLTGSRTEYAVLLIHGLNDSAYYMRDLAEVFKDHSINALAILLPGHGTQSRETLSVKAEDWRQEVLEGLDITQLLGKKTIIAGFSLGAALGIDAVLSGHDVHGLFLFSPALQTQYPILSAVACFPVIRSILISTDLPQNRVKYTKRSVNSICQLKRLINTNLRRVEAAGQSSTDGLYKFARLGRYIKLPTFIALTYGDARITPESVLAFSNSVRGPTKLVTYGAAKKQREKLRNGGDIKNLSDDALPHSFLVLDKNEFNPQMNPHFQSLKEEASKFIYQHFQ